MIKRFAAFGLFLTICLLSPVMAAEARAKPNILLIVSDDAGYADFGFQGCKDIPTPSLDGLAKSGLRMSQAYVAGPVCSPSRAAMLKGKTPARTGHENNLGGDKGGVDVTTELLPARLKKQGYHTGGIGKWHLGSKEEFLPWKRGFDEWIGFLGGRSDYLKQKKRNVTLTRNGVKSLDTEYLTDALSREAASFITRNAIEPWFLYLAYNAPHSPMQAPPGGEEMFPNLDSKRAVLAAMTASMDKGIGHVLDTLKATGKEKNTLVVFINDNGGATYSAFQNTPLRSHKGTLFEGGIRVSLLVRWPGVVPENKDFTHPVCATDLLPTFLSAAGAAPDSWKDSDGVDLAPYLSGKRSEPPHDSLCWRFNVVAAIRDGDWKLIRIRGNDPLLFNLGADPTEAKNLAGEEPERVKSMLQKISDWEKPFPSPKWTEGGKWEEIHVKDHLKAPVYR